jgi:hypothetical protein
VGQQCQRHAIGTTRYRYGEARTWLKRTEPVHLGYELSRQVRYLGAFHGTSDETFAIRNPVIAQTGPGSLV